MSGPYYADELVTLWCGDCRQIPGWITADVMVTDPPYGRDWRQGETRPHGQRRPTSDAHPGIVGDRDTAIRDAALAMWGEARPSVVFGDLMLAPPADTKQVLVYRKPAASGPRGATAGFRRDVEAVYLRGPWPSGWGGVSSVVATTGRVQGGPSSPQGRWHHPHAKPVDVLETLLSHCPPGVVADPFAGVGSVLVAARNQGRHAVGVEIDERYCEIAARRLTQQPLPF